MGVTINTDSLVEFGDPESIGLAGQVFDLQKRVEEVLKAKRAARIEQLKEQHVAKVVERREHGKTLASLRIRRAELQGEVTEIEKQLGDASFKLRLLRDQPPRAEYSQLFFHWSVVGNQVG